jgi:predicted nucleic acid-binding protein
MTVSVLDASVALKWVLNESSRDRALRVRNSFLLGFVDLIAPDLFELEIAHVLAKCVRRGLILDASAHHANIMTSAPRFFPARPLIPRALEIASHHRIGVYDCIYVALAEREGCELITADERLVRSLGTAFPFIVSLDSLP